MQTISKTHSHWQLKDVIFLAIIALFFGVIYQIWGFSYTLIAATPLKPFANDATLGVWLMAGPLAGRLIKKPGSATLGEFLAATIEMFLFSQWGAMNLVSGLIQGLGAEVGFASTKYQPKPKINLFISALMMTCFTFIWDLFQSGYLAYHLPMLALLFLIRFISAGFFAGILIYLIDKLLARTGVIQK
ncbi:ABC transporter permease [Weissella coleopterorum]|uniref:ABC transporter permease n=1 Tax=Weissella coleopterorum TaxID=2714949 RepID=A0A6G8B0Z7_9LACO|nr:ECF transporter S component [Weissella coleopterorum]QIL50984.1 ABC transporter permease [Weissella coleopterorum]